MNPLGPDRMTPSERLAEVSRLLALGLIRMRTRQSSQVSELTEKVRYTSSPTRAVMRNVQRRTA